MHIVYFYIRLYSFYGPCGPEIKLYYYYYYYKHIDFLNNNLNIIIIK